MSEEISAISAGKVDILCTPTPVTLERRETISFLVPDYTAGLSAVVRKDALEALLKMLNGEVAPTSPDLARDGQSWLAAGHAKAKKDESRSANMIVLKDSFYGMNTWDNDGIPESTRRRWRQSTQQAADDLVNEPLAHVGDILEAERLQIEKAA